ncbi:MAG: alpha/beta hydrolase [Variibacter sp.]|nr:alpha/beta hydrolase [Variibacter sp.]
MGMLKWTAIILLAGYLVVGAAMYVFQRSLMYFPETARTPPAAAGLAADEILLRTHDGETLVAWHRPPADGKPVIVYFHGNAGSLRLRAERFGKLTANGTGLLALSYRGYGGSTGRPSEAGLLADAEAAYAFAAARYPAERIVPFGESLGTGVAIALAAEHPVGKLILDAPFTAAVDLAAAVYPYLPVRLLMKDQFLSRERIGQVRAPVLILHGELDRVIPIRFAERLYDLVQSPKRFVRFPRGTHVDLDSQGAQEAIRAFLAE